MGLCGCDHCRPVDIARAVSTLTVMPLQPRPRPTLFLDCDHVIADPTPGATAFDRLRPACVARLDGLVTATGCRVVLSSTWRQTFTPRSLCAVLAQRGYRGTVDDATPLLAGVTRGAEIRAWLDAHPGEVDGYVVLDDWPASEFAGMVGHLVTTDPDAGLTDHDVARVVAMFAAQRVESARRAFMAGHEATARRAVVGRVVAA